MQAVGLCPFTCPDTSGGLIAAIMAAVPKGKKLIMARNSHKSVFNALNLADISPPGIPLVCPGEIYEKETLAHLKSLRDAGGKVIGIDNDGKVLAGA